jgi:succinyl-CoA synthetase alpha subunit
MSILVNRQTQVMVQGITGKEGRHHTLRCKEYGTRVVCGVSPGKGGQNLEGIPIFESVGEAKRNHRVDASLIFVPAPFAFDAMMEAILADIPLVVCITEGVPVHDMLKIKKELGARPNVRLIGPNCPGIVTPNEAKLGIMPGSIFLPGTVGVVSRSGTLTYETVWQLTKRNIGQSTAIGIGGDPIIGTNFIDCLAMFEEDPETNLIVLIGEIGGDAEEKAAAYIAQSVTKPVIAYICGVSAPQDKQMGHAGAIVSGGRGKAQDKIRVLRDAGIHVRPSIDEIAELAEKLLKA